MTVKCDDPDLPHLAAAVQELLNGIGEDGDREGLRETPARAAKAWAHWTSGYKVNVPDLLKCFEEEHYNEMVIVRDIPVYSHCEHHMAAIFGTATVAYVPNGRVLGLSKMNRLVDAFARRLQVQERMTVQIADALWGQEYKTDQEAMRAGEPIWTRHKASPLKPLGVGVMLRCRHMCVESRGVQQQGCHTVTTALRGVLAAGEPRAEFLAVANAGHGA